MKYVDINIFLLPFLYKTKKAVKCKEIVKSIARGELDAITSVLSWDELVYVISRNLGRKIAISEGSKFLCFPNLLFASANSGTIGKAQELISKYGIKPRDAIHAATAILSGADEIISDDEDFDKVIELRRSSI